MGFFDAIKGNEYKAELEKANNRIAKLESMLTPEMQASLDLDAKLKSLRIEIEDANIELLEAKKERAEAAAEARGLKSQIVTFKDEILVQDFGLYEPRFDFAESSQYKDALKSCRDKQKAEIKAISAQANDTNWTVNGSAAQGRKMVRETTKLLLRAYNGECDEIVRKVKTTNVNQSIERVYKSAAAINKLGTTLGISIPDSYQRLKEEEVRLAYEFAVQKEAEKEALREAREREREERKLAQEIAAERKKLEKEKNQYLAAYKAISERLASATDEERGDLEAKAEELKAKLDDVDAAFADVDYREANQKAGYVYVISNIGSFGEGVYKIGMTRRLDPMERIKELSDASVPFNFDVHALIFCDDAPKLEAALHREFEDRKLNIVNQRREFFRVSIAEIEEVVRKNYDKTVEFSETPDAEQFRTSEKMREQGIFSI